MMLPQRVAHTHCFDWTGSGANAGGAEGEGAGHAAASLRGLLRHSRLPGTHYVSVSAPVRTFALQASCHVASTITKLLTVRQWDLHNLQWLPASKLTRFGDNYRARAAGRDAQLQQALDSAWWHIGEPKP